MLLKRHIVIEPIAWKRMPRSDEATAFFLAVYRAVQEIPYGKVTSYGHIARLIGTRAYHPAPELSSDALGAAHLTRSNLLTH